MRLYIHDKCMEQLFELPKAIQKKVLEFQRKFRENSKSSAIHLEPISTFRDPLLRTARIDDKYRAIVKVPDSGIDYYLLWIDNHDEAMDWAKNKVFHWNENTQTAQIFTAPESELEKVVQPKADIGLFKEFSDDQLIAIGVPEQALSLVRSIKDLNELGDCEKYLPADVYENLFYLSDGANYEILLAEIREGKSKSNLHEDQVASINNKRSFVEIDDALMTEIIQGDLDKWQVFLHPSQRKLVESDYKGSVKVTGGAGTGKTVVALHRLKFLNDRFKTGDRKILFTTFTNALTVNLNKLADKLSINRSAFIITNIDALVRELAIEYNLINKEIRILDFYNSKSSIELWDELLEEHLSEFDASFLSGEYLHVILYNNIQTQEEYFRVSRIGRGQPITRKQRIEVWKLVELYISKKKTDRFVDRAELFNLVTSYNSALSEKPYSHVIADEIQDMSNVELRFLRSLVEEKSNDLFFVGDPYQKIYARKINFTAAGINVRGTKSKQLRINYRTSEEIKRLAISAVKGLDYDDFDGEQEKLNGYMSLFHGSQPTYELFRTKDKELEVIINYIENLRQQGYNYHDIAIGCRIKDSIKEIKTALHTIRIPYIDSSSIQSASNQGITLSTFHSLKGLEFKAVILADVNNRTAPLHFKKFEELNTAEKEAYIQSEKSLLYVAMTRAVAVLRITGTGIKSDLIKI